MANRPPVHVESRESGWAVVREGSQRASTVHQTQSEAAAALVGGLANATATAVGGAAEAAPPAGKAHGQEAERSSDTTGVGSGEVITDKEVRGLTDPRQDEASGTPEERYAGYEVYSQNGERIGKPDDLFVDEDDNPEYVGVWTDPSGSRSLLIPAEVVTVEDASRRMVVSHPKSQVQAGPSLERGEELTPELEARVRTHYALRGIPSTEVRGVYYRDDAGRGEERGLS